MSISANSRYAQSQLATIYENGQPRLTIVPGEVQPFVVQYVFHQVTANERIDQISYTYYKDATRWWVIADANPEILDFSSLTAGSLLRIPTSG